MSEDRPNSREHQMPSKRFMALLYIPLMIPAFIPLWMARDQDDTVILAIMYGTAVAILIGNALMLTMLYRWFEARTNDD